MPLLGLTHERLLEPVDDALMRRAHGRRIVVRAEHRRERAGREFGEMHRAAIAKRHARRISDEQRNPLLDRELHAAAGHPHPAPAEPAAVGLAELAVQVGKQQEHGRFAPQARDQPPQVHALLDVDELDFAGAVFGDEPQRVVKERAGRIPVQDHHQLAVVGDHETQLGDEQHQVAEVQPREHQRAAARERRPQLRVAFACHPVDHRLHRFEAVRAQLEPSELGLEQLAHDRRRHVPHTLRIVVQVPAQHVGDRAFDRLANARKAAQARARTPAHQPQPARGRRAQRDGAHRASHQECVRERIEQKESPEHHRVSSIVRHSSVASVNTPSCIR
ncbi:hypothetical protein VL15_10695 [Burkholderia cepacia]|uniref:Uncharacterized protein n=1 Tax=Burkholderia cepacia TaxID=292 RepID=A0A0J6A1T5_BURCE|nr:hypothetical protein VL15_10695 [Burkholderia cepacia]